MSEIVEALANGTRYRGLRHEQGIRFLGIPYAEAPTSSLRFKPPRPLSRAPEVIDATRPGPSAPQTQRPAPDWAPRSSGFDTSEDCLNLNVFTPAADDKRRPVVVHVFGGGFQTGSVNGGAFDDEGFAARGDVVLVRPNMRVGALGFLHLGPAMGEGFAPANRGMLDLIAALDWVRTNIAGFGGDPDNVTLVGMSSGAFTIGTLFGTEGTENLFRRAWMMSGSASRIVDAQTASAMADDFLERAGIAPGDTEALERLPVATILDIQDQIVATDLGVRNAPGGRTLGIVADDISLKRHPLEGLRDGIGRDTPIVTGWSRNEARMWYLFGIMKAPETRQRVLETIARYHPENAEQVFQRLQNAHSALDLAGLEETFLSETIYKNAALRTGAAQRIGGGNAYAYEFAWVPKRDNGRFGTAHGFDEPFVFGNVDPDRIPLAAGDPEAPALATRMSEMLYRFARTGDPGWEMLEDETGPYETFAT